MPEPDFKAYVENDAKPKGLLRKAGPAKESRPESEPRDPLWEDEDVLAWVAKRMKAGRTRDEMIAESDAGRHAWPAEGRHLTRTSADCARAIIRDRERRGDAPPKRRPNRSGRRIREIREIRKVGKGSDLVDIQYQIVKMTSLLESIDVESYMLDAEGTAAETLTDLVDDLTELQEWMERSTRSVFARLKDADKIAKIRKLRDTNGRTPEEIETAHRLADRLQRQLDQLRLASVS